MSDSQTAPKLIGYRLSDEEIRRMHADPVGPFGPCRCPVCDPAFHPPSPEKEEP